MCHVLVIEDEPLIADVICNFLELQGATSFDVATTEHEACRFADTHRPDFITSDIRITGGHGPDAVAQIRETHGEIPTVFITALPDECAPCDHAVAILRKPFSYEDLARAFSSASPCSTASRRS